MYNRPFCIWWDFRVDDVVVQTDHPQYSHVDYIFKMPFDSIQVNGTIDHWDETYFKNFSLDIMSGRVSIHKIMREQGHVKSNR